MALVWGSWPFRLYLLTSMDLEMLEFCFWCELDDSNTTSPIVSDESKITAEFLITLAFDLESGLHV